MKAEYAYIWEYQVAAAAAADFERIYGPDGAWVQLFRGAEGYLGSQLHRDLKESGRYLTIDYWRSRDDFEAFREALASDFEALDQRCESLTEKERFLGEFACVADTIC